MTTRDILNSNDIEALLTENSIEAIETFLSYYAVTWGISTLRPLFYYKFLVKSS